MMDAGSCTHYHECTSDSGYGPGAYEDLLNNAMGGRPWQECHCLSQEECAALAKGEGNG